MINDVGEGTEIGVVASAFGGLLRRAGIPVSAEQVGRYVRAIVRTTPVDLDELYWLGRITLLTEREQIETYDGVFGQVFRGLHDPADSRGAGSATSPPRSLTGRDRSASNPSDGRGSREARTVEIARASREERLATTDFADLDDDERRELRALMRGIQVAVPLRPARRQHRHPRGDRPDLRATIRRSRRTGGDPVERLTRRARRRPRKLVVLCDISGSMALYSRVCIQLLHAAAAGGRTRAEVFTFATRLTRLTRALSVADPDAALAAAAATAPDWGSGTRIGASLKAFVDRYGRRGLARGAVVVVVSDGWDRDDPALVGEQMQRLRRLAHRIVWINPRTAAPDYQPLAGGMAAALELCDQLVSGNTLASLRTAMADSLVLAPDCRSRLRQSGARTL